VGAASREDLEGRVGTEEGGLNGSLLRLENLGFVVRTGGRRVRLANDFIRTWLEGLGPRESEPRSSGLDSTAFSQKLTEIMTELQRLPEGSAASREELLDRVYEELRKLAHRYMGRERLGHTLQPTALVHEAYLRLVDQSRVDWQGRTHFFAMGAKMMRRVLIDHARGRGRAKRGGDWLQISWAEELRYCAGMTVEEVAQFLGVSKRTVESDWAAARDWLKERLQVQR
jgi:RNA polymerase sigma-70 factor (ECF subfamily)